MPNHLNSEKSPYLRQHAHNPVPMAPPDEEEEADEAREFEGAQDPMNQDAVRVVLEMGKASTSTLHRRLRLRYGRARAFST